MNIQKTLSEIKREAYLLKEKTQEEIKNDILQVKKKVNEYQKKKRPDSMQTHVLWICT